MASPDPKTNGVACCCCCCCCGCCSVAGGACPPSISRRAGSIGISSSGRGLASAAGLWMGVAKLNSVSPGPGTKGLAGSAWAAVVVVVAAVAAAVVVLTAALRCPGPKSKPSMSKSRVSKSRLS